MVLNQTGEDESPRRGKSYEGDSCLRNVTGRGRHRLRAPPRRTGRREHSGAGILKRFCPYPGRADSRYTRCTRYVQREENGSLMKSGADLRSAALSYRLRSQCGWYCGNVLWIESRPGTQLLCSGAFFIAGNILIGPGTGCRWRTAI